MTPCWAKEALNPSDQYFYKRSVRLGTKYFIYFRLVFSNSLLSLSVIYTP